MFKVNNKDNRTTPIWGRKVSRDVFQSRWTIVGDHIVKWSKIKLCVNEDENLAQIENLNSDMDNKNALLWN